MYLSTLSEYGGWIVWWIFKLDYMHLYYFCFDELGFVRPGNIMQQSKSIKQHNNRNWCSRSIVIIDNLSAWTKTLGLFFTPAKIEHTSYYKPAPNQYVSHVHITWRIFIYALRSILKFLSDDAIIFQYVTQLIENSR